MTNSTENTNQNQPRRPRDLVASATISGVVRELTGRLIDWLVDIAG